MRSCSILLNAAAGCCCGCGNSPPTEPSVHCVRLFCLPACLLSVQHAWRRYRLRCVIRSGMRKKWELHRKYVTQRMVKSVEGAARGLSMP